MPTVRVRNKQHTRGEFTVREGIDSRGVPYRLLDAGPNQSFEVGSVFLATDAEVAAFPDRLEVLEGQVAVPVVAAGGVFHPDVVALIMRANDGTASADERVAARKVLAFMSAQSEGGIPETAELKELLAEFDLSLFA